MTTALEDGLATPAEAMDALAISRKTLDRLVAQKVLQPVRLMPGSHRRFRRSDIARLVAKKED
jgi:excisionase family DNA binding protein